MTCDFQIAAKVDKQTGNILSLHLKKLSPIIPPWYTVKSNRTIYKNVHFTTCENANQSYLWNKIVH